MSRIRSVEIFSVGVPFAKGFVLGSGPSVRLSGQAT